MKIAIATSSVICDFDDNGSDGLLQTGHYSTLLWETSILRGMCPKCLPHKNFVYRRQFGELSRSIKSMEQFLASQGVTFCFDVTCFPFFSGPLLFFSLLSFDVASKFSFPSCRTLTIRCPHTWEAPSPWCTKSLHYMRECKDPSDSNYNWTNWISCTFRNFARIKTITQQR